MSLCYDNRWHPSSRLHRKNYCLCGSGFGSDSDRIRRRCSVVKFIISPNSSEKNEQAMNQEKVAVINAAKEEAEECLLSRGQIR